MWLANLLTVSRVPLAVEFWLTYGDPEWSLAILGIAALTDALDGTVARWARARAVRREQHVSVSTAGEWLDPLADKFFVMMVLGTIAVHEHTPPAILVAIVARELLIVPLGLIYRVVLLGKPRVEHAFQADALGKMTTIAQLVSVAGLVAHARWAAPVAIAAGALGFAAAFHYIVRATSAAKAKLAV